MKVFAFSLAIIMVNSRVNYSSRNVKERLIISAFSNYSTCLYFLSDPQSDNPTPVTLDGIQVLTATIDNIQSLKLIPVKCNGYVLVSNDAAVLNSLFEVESINLYFRPHQRVLLFTNQTIEARASTALHDLDLISVNNDEMFSIAENKVIDEAYFTKMKKKWLPEVALKTWKKKLCVALFDCPPYVVRQNKTQDGLEIQFLNELAKEWPLKFRFFKRKEHGQHLYSKVLAQIVENRCDIGICSQWNNNDFKNKAEISREYTNICLTILVPRPLLLPNFSFVFQPFQLNLWLASLGLISLITLALYAASNVYDSFGRNSYLNRDVALALTYVLKILSSGSVKYPLPHQISLRLLLLSWSTVCVLISTYYAAGFTMSLRFPRFSSRIDSFQQMIDQNIKWQSPDAGYKNWMENTSNPFVLQISKQYEQHGRDANQRLRRNDCGVLVEIPAKTSDKYVMFSEGIDEYGQRSLKVLGETLACFYTVFVLKLNSPYVDVFNQAVDNYVEHGFVSHWYERFMSKPQYWYMKSFFRDYAQEVRRSVDISNIQGAFHLLLLGYGMGFISFCLERLSTRLELYGGA